jgi:TPR repeat protein
MRAAAEAGVPRAQYFLGAALAAGSGSDRDLAGAVRWWIRAAERGVPQADAALAQLRLVALGRARAAPGERAVAELAFREFRAGLWSEHPDVARPAIGAEDGVGAALVRDGRAAEALPVLLREAAALGEPAQRQLEALYEQGLGDVAPYEPRILEYLQAAAAEGQLRPRLALARIYARGLGVPADVARATALLRATPHEEAQRLLRELVP